MNDEIKKCSNCGYPQRPEMPNIEFFDERWGPLCYECRTPKDKKLYLNSIRVMWWYIGLVCGMVFSVVLEILL